MWEQRINIWFIHNNILGFQGRFGDTEVTNNTFSLQE